MATLKPRMELLHDVKSFFGKQLDRAMKEAGVKPEDLVSHGISRSSTSNYIKGVNAPNLATIKFLAQKLNKPIDFFFFEESKQVAKPEQVAQPPKLLTNQWDYEKELDALIDSAQKKLYILNRTGAMYLGGNSSAAAALERAVMRGVQLRAMLPSTDDNDAALTVVAMGRVENPEDTETVVDHINQTRKKFQNLIKRFEIKNPELHGLSEVLSIPYPVSTVTHISDPNTGDGKALVLFVAFRTLVTAAPAILIYESQHKDLFQWFYKDAFKMWKIFGGELD